MQTNQSAVPGLRLAELLASLSLAIDLGLGQPMEHFLHARLLAVRLSTLLDLSVQQRSEVYYLGLIQHLGCTAGCIGYLPHPFKKETDVACPITLFPWYGTRWRDKGNRFFWLDGEKESPSGKHTADGLAARALGNRRDAGRADFFRRNLATP